MTWFAHQVLARPRPDVVAALRDAFGDALYRLDDLPASWRPDDDRRVPMPPDGLLVVRELCSPPGHDSGSPWEWFGSAAVSWLVGPHHDDEDVAQRLTLPRPGGAEPDEANPPAGLLLLLRQISISTDTVVSLFCTGFWGGEVEYAHAWTFTGREGGGVVRQHRRVQGVDEDGWDAWLTVVHAWDVPGTQDAPVVTPDGDVLRMTLEHHDVHLDEGGFFAAHQRAFDWEAHRLAR